MKKKLRVYIVEEELLHFKINICVGGYEEFLQLLETEVGVKGERYTDVTRGQYCPFPEHNMYFLYLNDREDIETSLTHELVHLVFDVFKSKGIPVCDETQEVFAYYQEWWLTKVKQLLH